MNMGTTMMINIAQSSTSAAHLIGNSRRELVSRGTADGKPGTLFVEQDMAVTDSPRQDQDFGRHSVAFLTHCVLYLRDLAIHGPA